MLLIKPKRQQSLSKAKRGFSLIEVLLALFILATVIAVVSQAAGQSVRNTTSLKESTFARWVALNQIELYQLESKSSQASMAAYSEGEDVMGDLSWRWVREVSPSSAADILEVKVTVYAANDSTMEENIMASVKSYVLVPNLVTR